jgi:hypothetical protein
MRRWNDAAPQIAIGMAGSPGHQAAALKPPGHGARRTRGFYRAALTRGGYDPMTAVVGGVWDALLGEGRHWWITASSDSHLNWRDGGDDFWPGEYSRTYVFAEPDYSAVLDGMRHGRVFVTTGNLISSLHLTAGAGALRAGVGETLRTGTARDVEVRIRFQPSTAPNASGERPGVARVDLIVGQVPGRAAAPAPDRNPTTRVIARFGPSDWRMEDGEAVIEYTLKDVRSSLYIRVRGTSTDELEPAPDTSEENPWNDLWFYSNPVFVCPKNGDAC